MNVRRPISLLAVFAMTSFLAVSPASADNAPAKVLDDRVWEAGQVLDEIMASPDQSIPEEMWAKCKAIAIYPNVLKGGFIIGAKFGRGVVIKKDDNGQWGAPSFSTIGGGSFGLQIGGSATDIVLVIMNERGMKSLLENNFTLGGDAEVAAGPVGRDTQASTDLYLKAGILSYSRSRGLFAGVSLDGAVLTQDNNSNGTYYGKPATSRDILLGTSGVSITPTGKELDKKLTDYSARWEKRQEGSAAAKDQALKKKYPAAK
jgi:SH3 domain-containing YSC84-like protein 1